MSEQTEFNQSKHSGPSPNEVFKIGKESVSVYDETLGEFRDFPLETRVKVNIFIDHQDELQGLVQVEPRSCRSDLTGVRALALATKIMGATLYVALNDMLGEVRVE